MIIISKKEDFKDNDIVAYRDGNVCVITTYSIVNSDKTKDIKDIKDIKEATKEQKEAFISSLHKKNQMIAEDGSIVRWRPEIGERYFVVLYGRSRSGVFGNSICSRRRGENTSLIYVMQQAAINLSLYAHKFERQRCFKILGCISMIHLSIGNRQFEHRSPFR